MSIANNAYNVQENAKFHAVDETAQRLAYKDMYTLFIRSNADTGETNVPDVLVEQNLYGNNVTSNPLNFLDLKHIKQGTIFAEVETQKDFTVPFLISYDKQVIEYVKSIINEKSAELLFHTLGNYHVNKTVEELHNELVLDSYADIAGEYSTGMVLIEYLTDKPKFYQELIAHTGHNMKAQVDNPVINSINIATLLLSYGLEEDEIFAFFTDNYTIDAQIKTLAEKRTVNINSSFSYSRQEFDTLESWQQEMFRLYSAFLADSFPSLQFMASLLVNFFLYANAHNIKSQTFVSQSYDILDGNTSQRKGYSCAQSNQNKKELIYLGKVALGEGKFYLPGAFPFDEIPDLDMQAVQKTKKANIAHIVNKEEHESVKKDISQDIDDAMQVDMSNITPTDKRATIQEFINYSFNNLCIINGMSILWAFYTAIHDNTMPFSLLSSIMQK